MCTCIFILLARYRTTVVGKICNPHEHGNTELVVSSAWVELGKCEIGEVRRSTCLCTHQEKRWQRNGVCRWSPRRKVDDVVWNNERMELGQ